MSHTLPQLKPVNQKSIKQIVGKAVGRYNRESRNDCRARVEFTASGFTVHTCVAKGDNVSWAQQPLSLYVFPALACRGYQPDFSKQIHTCGNVSLPFA